MAHWQLVSSNVFIKSEDGTFEGAAANPDDVVYNGVNVSEVAYSSVDKHDGVKSLRVRNFTTSEFIPQDGGYAKLSLVSLNSGTPFVAGRKYTLSGWIKFSAISFTPNPIVTGSPLTIKVGLNNGGFELINTIVKYINSDAGFDWSFFELEFISELPTGLNGWFAFDLEWDYSRYDFYPTDSLNLFIDTLLVKEEELVDDPPIVINSSKTNVTFFGGSNGTIDIEATGGVGALTYLWNDSFTGEDRTGLPAGNYTVIVTDTIGQTATLTITITQPDQLTGTISSTNSTANGADDGTITIVLAGGSGNRTYLWNDAVTTQNRSNLEPGDYSVLVSDVVTGEQITLSATITEPTPGPGGGGGTSVLGSILRFPLLNSIHFIVPDDNPQGLDNTLLCQQVYKGLDRVNYFQPETRNNTPILQFESDFQNHIIEMYRYLDNVLMRSFSFSLKEQNLGVQEDFSITIKNHTTPGKSRVYFGSGLLPIPLSVGDVFEILNNTDGFNGNYSIIEIVSDLLAGNQYLLINFNYVIGATSSAGTGRFTSNNSDYNVWESTLNFVGLDDGEYYFMVRAISDNEMIGISEPIILKDSHEGTFELLYRNNDDGFGDITWSTGYTGKILVPGHIGHKRLPGGDRSTSRNADYSLTKINAKKSRIVEVNMYTLPPYMIEKLSTIFDCDYFKINNVEYQTDDSLESSQLERDLMADATIKIETKGWFKKYNSNDIGTVNEGGFITTEQGFIKR